MKYLLLISLLLFLIPLNNPYSGTDPGDDPPRIPVVSFGFDQGIEGWQIAERANDGRIHTEGGIAWEPSPFGGANGMLKINCTFDGVPNARTPGQAAGVNFSMDGIPLQAPFPTPVAMSDQTFIQFDLYYPMNSNGKLMRIELWSSSSGGMGDKSAGQNKTQIYVRPESLEYLNGQVAGEYGGQVYRIKRLTARSPVSTGSWADLRFDIHGETASAWNNGVLFIDNVAVLQQQGGKPIPPVSNPTPGVKVASLKDKYSGSFLIGTTTGWGFDPLCLKHFNIVTPNSSLKAERVHPNPPQWLLDDTGLPFAGSVGGIAFIPEYTLEKQGVEFARVRDMGYAAHGHVLAWYTQGSAWMKQIIPQTVKSTGWNERGLFYAAGNGASPPFFPVNKELARKAYYEHILNELRYFSERNIPFLSFDVLNEEIHETRHAAISSVNLNEWKSALRNTSWLMAMTDNDYDDSTLHFVYLLFKYAHIAIPNAQMAAKYKANYANLPDYMKAHDSNIDAFVSKTPPILFYNDYDLYQYTKAMVTYNMVRELNQIWLYHDPLYDGRPLIEGIGIQGHDTVGPTLASDNQRAIALFAPLIDSGLLTTIAISELDLMQPDSAPGGAANSINGDILNQKQADAIAYQFALLFKVYQKYSKYISRVTFWGSQDPGWGGSYKLFDKDGNAAPAYYAVINPDRFIKGHSYLDAYFAEEYDRVK